MPAETNTNSNTNNTNTNNTNKNTNNNNKKKRMTSKNKTEMYAKVIKGEIHNVLSVMRLDPRYASPLRFASELVSSPYPYYQLHHEDNSNNNSNHNRMHPLLTSLWELNERLSLQEFDELVDDISSNSLSYLSPFCTAVSSPDISAPITGAALSAIHKFLLYGFLDPSRVVDAKEGITIVARCIRHCTFEESVRELPSTSRSSSRLAAANAKSTNLLKSSKHTHSSFSHPTQSSLLQHSITDEQVVLKLLSLASLTIRSPAGRFFLDPADVVGIFDTCLHVATREDITASTLLKSAAGDCLASIILVVFASLNHHHHHDTDHHDMDDIQNDIHNSHQSTDKTETNHHHDERQRQDADKHHDQIDKILTNNQHHDDASDSSKGSDDAWCQADPSCELDISAIMKYDAAIDGPINSDVHDDSHHNHAFQNSLNLGGLTIHDQSNINIVTDPSSSNALVSDEHNHDPLHQLSSHQQSEANFTETLDPHLESNKIEHSSIKNNDYPVQTQPTTNTATTATFPSSNDSKPNEIAQPHTSSPPTPPSSSSSSSALVSLMSRLANLINPLHTHTTALHNTPNSTSSPSSSLQNCTLALQLINIALETTPSHFFAHQPALLEILQNTLCKHLLHLTTTNDLVILSQTLRVIFNLFNSIKHHLKVQLEVFLTSVHLRILDYSTALSSATDEQREVVLESLLEFCHEPALMQDLYLNYDCDVHCSNLFVNIVQTLACVATDDPNCGTINATSTDECIISSSTGNYITTKTTSTNLSGPCAPTDSDASVVSVDAIHDGTIDNTPCTPPTSPRRKRLTSTDKKKDKPPPQSPGRSPGRNSIRFRASSKASSQEKEVQPKRQQSHHYDQHHQLQHQQPLTVLNKLACEGILAVIDSIARRCQFPSTLNSSNSVASCSNDGNPVSMSADRGTENNTAHVYANNDHVNEAVPTAVGFGSERRCDTFLSRSSSSFTASDTEESDSVTTSSVPSSRIATPPSSAEGTSAFPFPNTNDSSKKQTDQVLIERKRRKQSLITTSTEFNKNPLGKEWIQTAQSLHILPSPTETPESVAQFLYSTPKLDKVNIGLYLSKGPKEKYPFHATVLKEFVSLFDFSGMGFADALRRFLSKFRLPGEAQCIDRLMEAFATRLYQQQTKEDEEKLLKDDCVENLKGVESIACANSKDGEKSGEEEDSNKKVPLDDFSEDVIDEVSNSDTMQTVATTITEEKQNRHHAISPFRSADAAFVLSFSTIMLNTDLHNPTIKNERRMTLEQFIRNNRGINDGEDLPEKFLTDLYNQIKHKEIQVKRELSDLFRDDANGGLHQWDGLLSKSSEVAIPFFTSYNEARRSRVKAGVHERDMFLSIAPWAIQSISTIFLRSWNDVLVVKALKGLKQMASICIYFSMEEMFNQILEMLLVWGHDYISSTMSMTYSEYGMDDLRSVGGGAFVSGSMQREISFDESVDSYEDVYGNGIAPVPHALLGSANGVKGYQRTNSHSHLPNDLLVGSAAHRGLLSLDCGLSLAQAHTNVIRKAWPTLFSCVFALRDANALPTGLSDLDDFADSEGEMLPPSRFALHCQLRANKFILSTYSHNDVEDSSVASGLWSIFRKESTSNINHSKDCDTSIDDDSTLIEYADLYEETERINPRTVTSFFSVELLSVAQGAHIDQLIFGKKELPISMNILSILLDYTTKTPSLYLDDHSTFMTNELIFEHQAVFALELAAQCLFSNKKHAHEIFAIFMSKFEAILIPLKREDNGTLSNPYLMERVMVTILRSCIHLLDVPEMRPFLKTSLLLLIDLPATFLCHVADRLGCGMAIILRGSYSLLEAADEWSLLGDLLDRAAKFQKGRKFVFDGIASCVEDSLPMPYTDDQEQTKSVVTYEGASLFARLLLKFVFGSYGGDLGMSIPALFCLEKVYWYLYKMTVDHSIESTTSIENQHPIPDEDLWRSVCSAFYSVGLFNEPAASLHAIQSLERFIVMTHVNGVSDAGWIGLLETMTTKQPIVSLEETRIKTCHLLFKTIIIVIPRLSQHKDNWEALTEIVSLAADYAGENLRAGRRGNVSPLFERTVEVLTNATNVMSMPEFAGDSKFTQWILEILCDELEKVGAGGGLAHMVAAKRKQEENDPQHLAQKYQHWI